MLKLVTKQEKAGQLLNGKKYGPEAHEHHRQLIDGYFSSQRLRNYSQKSIKRERTFLESWFSHHGTATRTLFTWEAMEPVSGRRRIVDYGKALLDSGLTSNTLRAYLGMLSRYFAFVLEHPHIETLTGPMAIYSLYGSIEQPVSEFDIPTHVYEGEVLGIPLDPEALYKFYTVLQEHYVAKARLRDFAARNYAMVVLAGESGLRSEELMHLELQDLFFEAKKLQTRYAKGSRGSGKRVRITLFTPLARDTLNFYLKEHRPKILKAVKSPYVFPSRTGDSLGYMSIQHALLEMVKIARKMGFPVAVHMRWHWFRRIFATRFIERFPNQLSTLISLLGHVSPRTVHCYIRHSEAWTNEQLQLVLEGGEKWPSIGD